MIGSADRYREFVSFQFYALHTCVNTSSKKAILKVRQNVYINPLLVEERGNSGILI